MRRRLAHGFMAALLAAATAAMATAEPDVGGRSAVSVSAPEAPATGGKAALAARGVTLAGSMTGLWIGNVAGGMRTGGVYNTLGLGAVECDLQRLAGGWHGGRLFASAAWIRGGSVSTWYVGDALAVSNLDGFDSIRLYQLWLEQSAANGAVRLRAGCLAADEEFCVTAGGATFTNGAFGWEAGIGNNVVNGGPIYYAPGLGARLEVTPAPGWTARAGAYDGDSFDSPAGDPNVNEHGLHFQLDREQGAFLIGELHRHWDREGARHPGGLKLGAWRHTAAFADNRLDANGRSFVTSGLEPRVHDETQGGYAVIEQRLWTERAGLEQGASGWLRVAGGPADRSAFDWVGEAGLCWRGPWPGRDADCLGLGLVHARVSPERSRSVREANALDAGARVVPDFERVIEAAWQCACSEHLWVTPDVQWVQHPGTSRAIPDAWVMALRVTWQ